MIFLKRVGGIILSLTILLWFLLSYPGAPENATMPAIDYSFAGQIGHAMAVIFAPLGFNWQICIALVPGLAAREVAVGALATVYALSGNEDAMAAQLAPMIAAQWSLATALALLAWFVFAPQCISTLAVIRRETNSWKVMAASIVYLTGLGYLAAFVTYRVALLFS
ncbi:Fe(2+) transporter FeoB [compost metagenome]